MDPLNENKPAGSPQKKKLRRERASLLRRFDAAGLTPSPLVVGFDDEEPMSESRMRELRRIFHDWRAQLQGFAASPPPGDGEGDGDEPEPPAADPTKAPAAVSADPGGNGKPATPAAPDEAEQMRRALKSFRKDAVLSRLVASVRPFEPERVIEALDDLVEIDDDGALRLVDPESGKRLVLDAATLRSLIPYAVPPPPGAGPGSGGHMPNEMPRGGAAPDLIKKAEQSQQFYETHKVEVDAELRRRGRL